jgi:hypothetical protein
MNGTEGQERRHSERSIVGCGVDELGEGLDGAKTSAARVRTNEHFRYSHAPLLASRRPGTMFTSVCKFHAHCTSFHDIGRMRQQRSASTVVLTIIRYVRKMLLQTNYSAQDARETSTFGSSVALSQAVYRGPMSSLWVEIKESKKRWPTCNYRQVEYLCSLICRTERSCSSSLPICRAIYLPWRSNHQYHSSRPTTASCLQCCSEFSLYIRFVVPPAQFSPIKSPISLCIVSHAPP